MKIRAAALVFVVLGVAGCVTDYGNPFSNTGGTVAPPTTADLLFVASPDGSTLREIYALDIDSTAPPTRLTSCGKSLPACDLIEVAPAPDRQRVIVRRRIDTNGDGIIQDGEPQKVVVMDLARSIEGEVLADQKDVDSLQWTLASPELAFSALGVGGFDDVFVAAQDGTQVQNLTQSTDASERHPRAVGQFITFERATTGGVSEVWGAITGLVRITKGDTSLTPAPLPGTDYVVGSDADPEPSPDGSQIVFRRLVGLGEDPRGAWDIYKVVGDGTPPVPLAVGDFHGAPAWGPKGILFVESPAGGTTASLILLAPDGTRRTLIAGAPLTLQSPRWLR